MNKAFRALRVCLALLLCAALLSGCGSRSWRKGGVPGSKPYTCLLYTSGKSRAVQLVLVVHGQLIAHILRIVAGVLTAGLSEAGFGRAQVGTGTTEVHVHLVGQLVEDFFQLDGLGAQQHDVARGTVHVRCV